MTPRRRWAALAAMIVPLFMIQLDTMVLTVAVKTLSEPAPTGLGLSQTDLLWSVNAYTLVLAAVMLTAGWLGDRLGRRSVLLAGMAGFALASLGCAYAASPGALITFRALLGLGAALALPNTLAIIVGIFDERTRAQAIGIWSLAIGFALAAGPIVGGVLLDHFWWGSIFLVNVPVVVVGIGLVLALVPHVLAAPDRGIDLPGIILSSTGVALLVTAILRGGETGAWTGGDVLGVGTSAALVLVVFLGWEHRAAHPVVDPRWFAHRGFSGSIALVSIAFLAMSGAMFGMGVYVMVLRGMTPTQTGLLLLPFAAGQLATAPLAHHIGRLGLRVVGVSATLLLGVSLAGVALLQADTPVALIALCEVGVGVALGAITPVASNAIQSSVPPAQSGSAAAANNACRQIGSALGGSVVGSILSTTFRHRTADAFTVLPADLRERAGESLQVFEAIAGRLPKTVAAALQPVAESAFMDGYRLAVLVTVAVCAVLALGCLGLPGRIAPTGRPRPPDADHRSADDRVADETLAA